MTEEFTGPRTRFQEHLLESAELALHEYEGSSDFNTGVCVLVSQLLFDTPDRWREIAEWFGLNTIQTSYNGRITQRRHTMDRNPDFQPPSCMSDLVEELQQYLDNGMEYTEALDKVADHYDIDPTDLEVAWFNS